jgi:hypothetical protein
MKKSFITAVVAAVWFGIGCAIALQGQGPDPLLSANDNEALLEAGVGNAAIGLIVLAVSITWWIAKFREWRNSRYVTFIYWG